MAGLIFDETGVFAAIFDAGAADIQIADDLAAIGHDLILRDPTQRCQFPQKEIKLIH